MRGRLSGAVVLTLAVVAGLSTVAAFAAAAPVQVVVTDENLRHALALRPGLRFGKPRKGLRVIHVDERIRFQKVKGVGAAMTDSSAWLLLDQLPNDRRGALLKLLFGKEGIHLDFLRIPIAASDFTAGGVPYSYDDMAAGRSDPSLASFSIAHDLVWDVPMIHRAEQLNPQLFVLASPWSAPGWMKHNGALDNRDGNGWFLEQYDQALAGYSVAFLRAYAAQGIRVDAVTPQNEPMGATSYPGMALSESAEANLILNYLAPGIRTAGMQTRIYGSDSAWAASSLPYSAALSTGPVARELGGIATHCYNGTPAAMSYLHDLDPQLDQVVSECSPGLMRFPPSELIIGAMRNWASAVALWNLALDQNGRPVQPPNAGCSGCTAVVTVNTVTHKATYTLSFYQLGQFSKFVARGAVRIGSDSFVRYVDPGSSGRSFATPGLDDVAFLNPDGSKVLLAYNNSPRPQAFNVTTDRRWFSYTLAPRATATFIWDRRGR